MDGMLSHDLCFFNADLLAKMLHVWDHSDFTQDTEWFKAQGWPLLKVSFLLFCFCCVQRLTLCMQSVAQFHLQKLIPDERFNDSTLVVNPCNSPEQVPITLGEFYPYV